MFETMTYENILASMLNYIPDNLDKREGSIIYDALAPAAVKIAETYIDLDLIIEESFADTSSRPYLVLRCRERGIYPTPATSAIVEMRFNIDVEIGTRFSFSKWNFRTVEKISTGKFKAICEETGPVYGVGDAVPIDYVEGLEYARVTEILINGEEEESTESLRSRYFDSFTSQAFGGNRADYIERVPQLQDIGAIRVKRITENDPNIRLTIINSTFDGASEELINTTQTLIDPTQNKGEGLGLAPIGHHVIVEGVASVVVNINTSITVVRGYSYEDIKSNLENAVKEYISSLNQSWAGLPDGVGLVVRISQIEAKLLGVDGVLDIKNTKVNGSTENLVLKENEIAKRGELVNA